MSEDKSKYGVVTCESKTVVRENPDSLSDVICELENGTNIMIDHDKSTSEFVNICTEYGIEGYCLSDDIELIS